MTTLPVELLLAFGLMAVACECCGLAIGADDGSTLAQCDEPLEAPPRCEAEEDND